jgi:SAM-dependent methyltransferase
MEWTEGSTQLASTTEKWPVVELSECADFHMHDAYYQHATQDHFWIQWRFQVIHQLLQEFDVGSDVLEIGSGNGVVQAQFEAAFGEELKVVGCDLNRYALEQGPATRGGRYLYNVLDRRDEWRERFSSAILLDTLEHIDEAEQFLHAMRFHLQPCGLLIINVPALPALYSRYDAVQGHVKRYTATRLVRELMAAGFEVLDHRYWGGNLVPIAMLRKLMVRLAKDDDVLTKGFAPPSAFADRVLRRLKALENAGWKLPLGTSIAAIARRRPDDASSRTVANRGSRR